MIRIEPISAFTDNYIWLLSDRGRAFVVDPGDGRPVLAALAEKQLSLEGILVTHHHADHVGGIPELLAHKSVPVYGPHNDGIATLTRRLAQGETVEVLDCRFEVMEVPGHTLDHIAYYAPAIGALFCGDTMFGAGCGRLFEGTAEMMCASLNKLAALPAATKVYCAHEYTVKNLRFAHAVEPGNHAVLVRMEKENEKRKNKKPTLPSEISLELATNPFLRRREPEIVHAADGRGGAGNEVEVFATIRQWKDTF